MKTHSTSTKEASRAPQGTGRALAISAVRGTSQLARLQSMADNSAQSAQLQKYAAAMARPAPMSGKGVMQGAFELCKDSDVTPSGDHRAKKVRAENITGDSLGPAANSPSVEPFGWQEMKYAGHTLANTSGKNSHYNAVRAHLMNGRLGGPGNATWNLVPAPAQINSQMSAGPETAAKNLVDAGRTIWLETEVEYHSASTTATDFTAVVPKKIRMQCGPKGQDASHDWSKDIVLPVAPLSGSDAKKFEDWEDGKTAELEAELDGESDQVRGQAYDLVKHGSLKLAILKKYPSVYLSMTQSAKGALLNILSKEAIFDLMTKITIYATQWELLTTEAIMPLAVAGHPLKAQELFKTLDDDGQYAALISWKIDLLAHLGAVGEEWAGIRYTVFNYFDDYGRARVIDGMSLYTLSGFLRNRSETDRMKILDNWAKRTHPKGLLADDWEIFDRVMSSKAIAQTYKNEYFKKFGKASIAAEHRDRRASRSKKKTK